VDVKNEVSPIYASAAKRRRVMAQVIVDEAGDEVVAVVVARMQAQVQGWPAAAQAWRSFSGCNCVLKKPSASP
jgi:hypothetical protein